REARAGRIHECGAQTIGGFPFRIEVRCANPSVELRGKGTPLALKAADLLVAVQIYQPSLMIGEFSGPMTIAEGGQQPGYIANWTLGQSSVRGTPRAPERVSLVVDNPVVERSGTSTGAPLFKAKRVELHGRIAAGSTAKKNPVIAFVLRAAAASAPELHPAMVGVEADIVGTLRGLADFSPKPWPVRFKEMQARDGRIEITSARIQRGEVIAVSAGTLGLTERGGLQGQMQMTVVNLEQLLKELGIEQMMSRGKVSATIDSLDRLVPGLGAIARKRAGPGIIAGLGAIGQRTVLEGKPAVSVPLRFVDGRIMLGPFPVGRAPPLF
ncbi:MAG: DUF2125 domain-containing protein, partial [Xanthobacteraceae bacterium]